MYRLAKTLHRPLGEAVNDGGEPDGNEFLAVPAKEYYDRSTGYRPPGLERCAGRQERVRLEPVLLPGLSAGLLPVPPAASGGERRPTRTTDSTAPRDAESWVGATWPGRCHGARLHAERLSAVPGQRRISLCAAIFGVVGSRP
ncbi:hypothetical protein [Streptomyces sp. KMM 9044]|uniref:hypothetical protein n=1 Tax=Streptomyces sp. KMM 9044 TaxID=2744474 RepID=UPI002150BE2A|nr:hypothetical protein [Streptomyces sp. KMM 9044]WAX81668.1 hypothetical protein HUV60_032765 [Streptomyces sp. KMM 9044]